MPRDGQEMKTMNEMHSDQYPTDNPTGCCLLSPFIWLMEFLFGGGVH